MKNTAKHQSSGSNMFIPSKIFTPVSLNFFRHFSARWILTISCGPKTDLNRGLILASFLFANFPITRKFSAFLPYLYSPPLSPSLSVSYKNHTVWRACLVGSGQAPASTLLRSPGWCPVVLARSTPFLFSTVVRAKTFSINASFFLLLSAGRRVRAKAILKTPARCNKANCFSHA